MIKTNWFHVATGAETIAVPADTEFRNAGVLAVAGVPSPAELDVDAVGGFENDRLMIAGNHGTFVLAGGNGINAGTMEAIGGGRFQIEAAILNTGRIIADGGTVTIENALTQQGRGEIDVTHNGTLIDTAPATGGTIKIQSGMLQLEGAQALGDLASQISFIGSSGRIDFAGAHSVTETFSQILHSPVVRVDYGGGLVITKEIAMADSYNYVAGNFSVQGHDLTYTAHSII